MRRKNGLRRAKFSFPLKDKTVIVRARSLTEATMKFRRYHGGMEGIDLKAVTRELVSYEDADDLLLKNKTLQD